MGIPEAGQLRHTDFPHAKVRGDAIFGLPIMQGQDELIKIRILKRPKSRLWNRNGKLNFFGIRWEQLVRLEQQFGI